MEMETELKKRKAYWREVWDVSKDEVIAELAKNAKFREAVDDYAKRKEEELEKEKRSWGAVTEKEFLRYGDFYEELFGEKRSIVYMPNDYKFYITKIESNIKTEERGGNIYPIGDLNNKVFVSYEIRGYGDSTPVEKETVEFSVGRALGNSLCGTFLGATYPPEKFIKIIKDFNEKVESGEINRNKYLLNRRDRDGVRATEKNPELYDYIAQDAMYDNQKRLSFLRRRIRVYEKEVEDARKEYEEEELAYQKSVEQ